MPDKYIPALGDKGHIKGYGGIAEIVSIDQDPMGTLLAVKFGPYNKARSRAYEFYASQFQPITNGTTSNGSEAAIDSMSQAQITAAQTAILARLAAINAELQNA